ncbi:hypothetical protein HRI_000601800 [Hibiscus trionum]|uniref:Uncharacterized protein n=1 Tax=Hibiscus trionum TaxID=183268 RepID=A0A9W7H4M6_HIBTR|nr:hypothetical protein HRI_000601800 [Hibiscus trionum]
MPRERNWLGICRYGISKQRAILSISVWCVILDCKISQTEQRIHGNHLGYHPYGPCTQAIAKGCTCIPSSHRAANNGEEGKREDDVFYGEEDYFVFKGEGLNHGQDRISACSSLCSHRVEPDHGAGGRETVH